jgi:hypothetical protein
MFVLPQIPSGAWTVELRRFGNRPERIGVEIAAGQIEDRLFELLRSYVADDFEAESGWTVGAPDDDATSGIWVRDDPIGTGGGQTAPEDDASEAGALAFVTGNGGGEIGDDDVDGGQTTLSSPSYDLSEIYRPWLEFRLWYHSGDAVDPESDVFSADASSDGGATWTTMLEVTQNTAGWEERRLPIGRFVQLGSEVRFRFIARDSGFPSLVEVGLDDVQIYRGREGEEYFEPFPEGVRLVLEPPFPNPFRDRVRVRFRLDSIDQISLEVFDAAGRRIRRMARPASAEAPEQLVWDGRTDFGDPAPSGAYWLLLRTSRDHHSMRVVRIR